MAYPNRLRTGLALCLLALGLSACGPQSSQTSDVEDSVKRQESPGRIAARVGDQVITYTALNDEAKLALHDLAMARYRVQKQTLNSMIERQQASAESAAAVEVFLEPPFPPRVELPARDEPRRGPAEAAVTLSVFCGYESSHCARIQPILATLRQEYPQRLAEVHYDAPQSFHRNDLPAALAARCAGAEGQYWGFHDALYALRDFQLSTYRRIAGQLGLDVKALEQCLADQRFRSAIEADVALVDRLGLGNVPVVFVNGLYVKGPQPASVYRRLIDEELRRQGLQAGAAPEQSQETVVASELPLKLLATSVNEASPDRSSAMIEGEGADVALYHPGDELLREVILLEVTENRIWIRNAGRREYISLQGSRGGGAVAAGRGAASTAQTTARTAATGERPTAGASAAAAGAVPLSRDWLDQQLNDREALAERFKPAELVVEGVHLLRLEEIGDSEFYRTLGLQSGDVILRVGDEWVHENQNRFLDALDSQQAVTIQFIRNGLPKTVRYEIGQG
ncbi:thioredoxin domain-containing protein [Marinobacteraceae bacterium S3BR75-40.1]